jgi:hypothetical protein
MHEHHEGTGGCLITVTEAQGLAGVSDRTLRAWVAAGDIQKMTKGPAGYWVRYCRLEVAARASWRPAGEVVGSVGASAAPG